MSKSFRKTSKDNKSHFKENDSSLYKKKKRDLRSQDDEDEYSQDYKVKGIRRSKDN